MNIAIIDDDPQAAKTTKIAVEDAGMDTWIFNADASSIASAAQAIMVKSNAAVCDHRLRPLGLADFDGAELVAYLIERSFPAILISQFVSQDYDVSIRHWRAKLPSVLTRDEFHSDTFAKGLQQCEREIKGDIPPFRKAHRTLFQIKDIQRESNQPVVDVILPSWSNSSAVRFPLNIVPEEVRSGIKVGAFMLAYVNIGARDTESLFFEGFELPPTPHESIFGDI